MHLTHSPMVQISTYIKLLGYCWAHGKSSVSERYYICCYIKIRALPDNFWNSSDSKGFPGDSVGGREPACQCRRHGFKPWVREIFWRKKWQPTPLFLPGESHGQRSLVGYSPWGHKESDMPRWLTLSLFWYVIKHSFLGLRFFRTVAFWAEVLSIQS